MAALCSCWTQLVRALCGDPRRNRQLDPTERQQLLSVDGHSDTHISTAHSAAAVEDVPDSPSGCTTLIVMRHGHRKDEETPKWHLSANRPWDPPLSSLGRQQVRNRCLHPPISARGHTLPLIVHSALTAQGQQHSMQSCEHEGCPATHGAGMSVTVLQAPQPMSCMSMSQHSTPCAVTPRCTNHMLLP
jgi:hypothetical protein